MRSTRLTVTIALAAFAVLAFTLLPVTPARAAGFTLDGGSANYALLYEGAGGNQLSITNVTVNGNIGVGGSGKVADSGPSTITGRLDFSAANTGQFSSSNGSNVGPTSVNYSVGGVTSALNSVNNLNSTLGAEAGASIAISGNTTLNASAGTLDVFGNRVFSVSSFNLGNGQTLTINGSGSNNVVFNFGSDLQYHGNTGLTGGITADQVLFNVVGGSGLTGGHTLDINNNGDAAHPLNAIQGVFLDPNGTVSVVNSRITAGRVFGGDTANFQFVSGNTITTPASVPEPASLLLLGLGLLGLLAWRRKHAA